MERSKAAIAAPCDKPITPSYWFLDSSSDHHLTWPFFVSVVAVVAAAVGTEKTDGLVPSVRCVHVVL
jgi:hypothetical protein